MTTTQTQPKVGISPRVLIENTYEERSALFGIIKYWHKVKTRELGEELHIFVEKLPKEIYLNGDLLATYPVTEG